jgi:hypothetical protein
MSPLLLRVPQFVGAGVYEECAYEAIDLICSLQHLPNRGMRWRLSMRDKASYSLIAQANSLTIGSSLPVGAIGSRRADPRNKMLAPRFGRHTGSAD